MEYTLWTSIGIGTYVACSMFILAVMIWGICKRRICLTSDIWAMVILTIFSPVGVLLLIGWLIGDHFGDPKIWECRKYMLK